MCLCVFVLLQGVWVGQTTLTPFRHAYTYMFPNASSLWVVGTRDTTWESLGYTTPDGSFGYDFSALGAYVVCVCVCVFVYA